MGPWDRFAAALSRHRNRATALRRPEVPRTADCYQMRYRSPVTSADNYLLKMDPYALHPFTTTTGYFFFLRL